MQKTNRENTLDMTTTQRKMATEGNQTITKREKRFCISHPSTHLVDALAWG